MAETVAETERLALRTWDPADRAEYARHLNTSAVTRHLGGVQSDEELAAAFDRLERYQREHGHTFWVVERKSDGAVLGFCGLKVADVLGSPVDGEIEIGWRLREDAWGQGYAKEAAEAALDWAWANLGVERVVAFTIPINTESRRLMERLGMVRRPDLDFAHPAFASGHPLSQHVTYVAERPRR
ncbi:MAG TPA: GNAT family N-acetyltransferase [Sphingomicrobium sp.]|nr:GNAT family N-acetyltransferase [Sphingomicrobium sp.]